MLENLRAIHLARAGRAQGVRRRAFPPSSAMGQDEGLPCESHSKYPHRLDANLLYDLVGSSALLSVRPPSEVPRSRVQSDRLRERFCHNRASLRGCCPLKKGGQPQEPPTWLTVTASV